jgi:hypothetical protein
MVAYVHINIFLSLTAQQSSNSDDHQLFAHGETLWYLTYREIFAELA